MRQWTAPDRATLSGLAHQIAAGLPEGRPLPDPVWRRRHQAMLALLWIHAFAIAAITLASGAGPVHSVQESLIPASLALLATIGRPGRRFRATVASLGMVSTSAILVHLSGGLIEMHFHFFVVVAVITLYQDWVPFLFAIGFVTLHHGLVGVLDPTAVYNHPDAWAHPWKWAVIHGSFVLAASVAGVVNWRLNEGARAMTEVILNAAGEGIYVLDGEGRVVFANPATGSIMGTDVAAMAGWAEQRFLEGLGGSPGEERPLGTLPGALVVEGTLTRHAGSTVFRRGDGSEFPVDFVATPLRERRQLRGAVVTITDVTDRLRAEEALRASEAQFRLLFANNPHPMWVYDPVTLDFLEVNDAAVAQYGYSAAEFAGMRITDVSAADAPAPFPGEVTTVAAGGERSALESIHRRKSGEPFTVALTSHRVQFARRPAMVVVAQDISERVRFQEELAHQALHDALTGLPNRALFSDRLERAMLAGDADERSMEVLFLDLDGFKVVNDGLGHDVGDELLISVSERLAACLLPEDTIARFGGDEFVVLLQNRGQTGRAAAVAAAMLTALRPPFQVSGRDVFITSSIGIAIHNGGGSASEAHDLVRKADIAMYQAKAAGKAQVVHFERSMAPLAIGRLERETDLRRAVEEGEWVLDFQPEVDLHTGRVVGVEALVRWRHPERGIVSPAEFIPLAEEIGLIAQIGGWVLREACRQAQQWRAIWPAEPRLVVGVNVSSRELAQPDFVAKVQATLEEFELEPQSLRIELTESAAMHDPLGTVAVLQELGALGVELALDDFGTGYSSLSYLSSLPIDILKIDQAFVRALAENPSGTAIVKAIVAVAEALSMTVTAEGIETAQQLAQLRGLGCDRGQGYHLARPLTSAAFEEFRRASLAAGLGAAA